MGQNLTALNFGLALSARAIPAANDTFRLIRPLQELAAQTARDLHRVALELRPAALDDLGLVKAFEIWSRRRHAIAKSRAISSREITIPAGVSSEIETTLYRLIQEALNNVAKHSGAGACQRSSRAGPAD